MADILVSHWPCVRRFNGGNGYCGAVQRHELYFEGFAQLIDVDDYAHITGFESFFGQVPL